MMETFFLSGVLVAILLVFGTGVARWLRIDDGFSFAGITAIGGSAAWIVLINALGFILPVGAAVWSGLLALLVADIAMHASKTKHITYKPPQWAIFLTGGVIALCAFASMRFSGSDPWSWQHFPLAASIVAGNLPALTPIDPLQPLAYHYGPQLLAAAISIVTGASLAAGFWSHPIIGSAGVVLCAAGLAWQVTRSWRAAVLGGVLALMGGGLSWLNVGNLVADLWAHVIAGPPLSAPFRALTSLFDGHVATGLLPFFGHRSTAMGYPLLFGVLLTMERAMHVATERWKWICTGIVLTLALALTHELSAVAIPCCMLAAAIVLAFVGKRSDAKNLVIVTLSIFIPAIALASVQGGVLSHPGGEGDFGFGFDGTVTYNSWGDRAGFFDLLLWKDFGLPVLLLPFAGFLAWKYRRTTPFLAVLTGLVLAHLVVPFVVQYNAIEGEMRRLFYTAISVGALLGGIAIDTLLLESTRGWRRTTGWLLIVAMLGSSLAYLPLRLLIPNFRFEPAPIFAQMPAITEEQKNLYAWVRDNTTQDDWFYLRSNLKDFHDISQEQAQQRDRVLFMTYTGRFTLGQVIFWNHDSQWLTATKHFEATCDSATFRNLHLAYLVVETPDRDAWFASHCNAAEWEPVYVGDIEQNLPRILQRRPS